MFEQGKMGVIVGCWEVVLREVEKGYLSRSEMGVIVECWEVVLKGNERV